MRIRSSGIQCDVAPGLVQSAVDLQVCVHAVALVVAFSFADVVVHGNAVTDGAVLLHVVLGERVVHEGIRVLVERHVLALAVVVRCRVAEVWCQHNVGHAVNLPFKAEVGVDVLAAVQGPVAAVVERRSRVVQELLAVVQRQVACPVVVVSDVTSNLEQSGRVFGLVVVPGKVESGHLAGYDAASAAPSAASASGESLVVHVVDGADYGHLEMVCKAAQVHLSGVTVFRAVSHVCVQHPSFLHALLYGQVQYGLFLAVVNAGNAAVVALAVIRFYLVHHLCGQVLHGHLGVVVEEFLSAHHDFLYGLSVYLDGTVVFHFCSGQFAHQFLQV